MGIIAVAGKQVATSYAPLLSQNYLLEFMDPVVTRARTLAFIASVLWWIAAFPLGPTVGKLLAVPRLSVLILSTWVLCASLSSAVLSVEILRAIIPRWSTWTNRHHFYVVLAVATAFGLLWILVLAYGFSRGFVVGR
jgi:hypothetical protein